MSLNEQADMLKKENNELEQLVELLQDEKVVTFADGRYCDDIHEAIMELLSMFISMGKLMM